MNNLRKKLLLSVGLPVMLISTTALVFYHAASLLGLDWGYLIGFLFYWIIWCYLVPYTILRRSGFIGLFSKSALSLFQIRHWYLGALLLATVVGAITMFFLPKINAVQPVVIFLAIPIAVIAGTSEEILWRGVYIRSFPRNIFLAYLLPTIWFSIQHLSSQLPEWSSNDWIFIISTFPLGVVYGLVAYRTNSIRWNAIAHSVIAFFGLAMPVTTSLYNLFFY